MTLGDEAQPAHGRRDTITYMSSTGLCWAAGAAPEVDAGVLALETSMARDDPLGAAVIGPFVAFPRNAESDISSSFLVTRAPRTAARSLSFWVKILVRGFFVFEALLSCGMGCCFTIRFKASADFACV